MITTGDQHRHADVLASHLVQRALDEDLIALLVDVIKILRALAVVVEHAVVRQDLGVTRPIIELTVHETDAHRGLETRLGALEAVFTETLAPDLELEDLLERAGVFGQLEKIVVLRFLQGRTEHRLADRGDLLHQAVHIHRGVGLEVGGVLDQLTVLILRDAGFARALEQVLIESQRRDRPGLELGDVFGQLSRGAIGQQADRQLGLLAIGFLEIDL
ncbi:MAG: hypothetical protein MOGMAGMI_02055 [Candidatus Omnitrophica bacterium]|nr:hypothetical protein [Candidatus Omnitrophota bacterium]